MPSIKPYYGTQFAFKSLGSAFESNDGYVFGGNIGVNNLGINVNVMVPSQTDAETSGALTILQNLSGTGFFQLDDPSLFYNSVWLNIDSFAVDYKFQDINDVRIQFSANHNAKSLRWTGSYLNDAFIKAWSPSSGYKKYDVVYYVADLTTSGNGVVSGNYTDRFFYARNDVSGGSTPLANTGDWSEYDLPVELEIDLSTEFIAKNEATVMKGAFDQRVPFGQVNPNRLQPVSVSWQNLTSQQARCLLHFFENKQGYKRFNIRQTNSQWGPNNVFVCQDWKHTMNYYDSHNVQATFIPDMRFKNAYFTGFSYGYTDLNPLMRAQWVGYSGIN